MRLPWPEIAGYDVEAELGRGGMGVVYRVHRRATNTTLALKMLMRGQGASFTELARFRVEAEALACLNHPNIVKIRDVGIHAGIPYFAMEFASGGSLKEAMAAGPRPAAWAADLVRTLALAMQHAHDRGMLHRDLKPANVLLMSDGTPRISDFGLVKFADPIRQVSSAHSTFSVDPLDLELSRLAHELGAPYQSVSDAAIDEADADGATLTYDLWRQCSARTGLLNDPTGLDAIRSFLEGSRRTGADTPTPTPTPFLLDDLTRSGALLGSPRYMAPEQAAGDRDRIGPATDVYALGAILYELLTGAPLFTARHLFELTHQTLTTLPKPPRQLVPEVPAAVEAICLACLEKQPGDRYTSAGDLADDLARVSAGLPTLRVHRVVRPAPIVAADETTTRPAIPPPVVTPTRPEPSRTPLPAPTATRSWWPFRFPSLRQPADPTTQR